MDFDFDFKRYVERKQGAREQASREGAAYAYSGDLKVLRALDGLRPVRQALETAAKLWHTQARAEVFGPGLRASMAREGRAFAAAQQAASRLHVPLPTLIVSPQLLPGGSFAWTFGTADDSAIVLHASLVERCSDGELLFVVGRECGHLQNGHVMYRTALHFLTESAGRFVRWVVKPAVAALAAWHARAEITADRAGLLCARDLDVAVAALTRLVLGPDGAAADAAPDPGLARRVAALRLFAESAYFRGVLGGDGAGGGSSAEACDAATSELFS